jgi:hypothetical protein
MGGGRIPGPLGLEPGQENDSVHTMPPGAGFEVPGPIGMDESPIVREVVKDWDPPSPSNAPTIVVRGKTLAQVVSRLNALPEWGRGGGSLRSDRLRNVRTPEVTVHLHANLVFVLPRWEGYEVASPQAKAEWDRMIEKLRIHEQRHVDIAIEEADRLAAALIGEPMSRIASMVTRANATMAQRQQELDTDTEYGSKSGVRYGNVSLDASVP